MLGTVRRSIEPADCWRQVYDRHLGVDWFAKRLIDGPCECLQNSHCLARQSKRVF